MEIMYIPQADTIPVAWGWLQFLLLLTFPLHLLAMNAMLGSLTFGLVQHIQGGNVRKKLAHRIGVVLPLLVATTVNLGVAPLLFLQVLYGQFNYSSSVMMGTFWIMIIPLLIIAYYAAYLYDFKFMKLGREGLFVGMISCIIFFVIGSLFTNNMLLMLTLDRFKDYFTNSGGTLLIFDEPTYIPRYLHMMFGSLAIGGLFIAILGRFKASEDKELSEHSKRLGMRLFFVFTIINIVVGGAYLIALPKEKMMIFMGQNMGATIVFTFSLLLTLSALLMAYKKKIWLTVMHAVLLVYLMVFMRSWLRSGYLQDYFNLGQLEVIPQYSPFIFFIVTLCFGLASLFWLWKKCLPALKKL